MLYLISYDIEDNRERTRLARILGSYGNRVQFSVFECELDAQELKELVRKVRSKIRLGDTDSIRIYSLCEKDERKTIYLGAKPQKNPKTIII